MNIVKLQNMLKSVPDKALINYVQNPTGEVPSYLALSELKRRQDMRANYQKEQAPQSSVAEDLTQTPDQSGLAMLAKNPQPGAPTSQGVADLPTGDMYQEQNFATGGIVAFAKGGSAFDEYGIEMPPGATLDDISMEMQESNRLYGVDPEFYKKQAEEYLDILTHPLYIFLNNNVVEENTNEENYEDDNTFYEEL